MPPGEEELEPIYGNAPDLAGDLPSASGIPLFVISGPPPLGWPGYQEEHEEEQERLQKMENRIAALETQALQTQRLIEGIIQRVGIDRFAEIVKDIEYDTSTNSGSDT